VGVAGQVADDDANGFSLVKGRLSRRLFKVQGVQKFKGQKGDESDNFERLNL
jgi:hypothetical protein